MAGLAMFGLKKSIEATTPIATATAFKFCIRHRKNGLLNRLHSEVQVFVFLTRFSHREVTSHSIYRTNPHTDRSGWAWKKK
jgi:hypothetical protein